MPRGKKETTAPTTVPDSNTAQTLLSGLNRMKELDEEIKNLNEQKKEEMAGLKGMGFDTKIVRKVLARSKRKPDEVAEEDSMLHLYESAIETARKR